MLLQLVESFVLRALVHVLLLFLPGGSGATSLATCAQFRFLRLRFYKQLLYCRLFYLSLQHTKGRAVWRPTIVQTPIFYF